MADAKNMSLDEIIALNKKSKSGRSVGGFRSEKEGRGGKPRVGAGGNRGFHTSKAPSGKWKHDKFEENNSISRRGGFAGRREGGAPRIGSGNPNKIVRVLMSNLAPSVITADLEELFEPYNYDSVSVHYNETGDSLGTGDVHLTRKDASRMITDLKGMAIDGEVVTMAIVDESGGSSIADRIQFNRPLKSSGGVEKRRFNENKGGRRFGRSDEHDDRTSPKGDNGRAGRGNRNGGGRNVGGRQNRKPKMTEEELDKQLDVYMKKNKDDNAME